MMRCHDGSTVVVPSGPLRRDQPQTTAWLAPRGTTTTATDRPETTEAWAVHCARCDRCLAVVEGPRDEVYADL